MAPINPAAAVRISIDLCYRRVAVNTSLFIGEAAEKLGCLFTMTVVLPCQLVDKWRREAASTALPSYRFEELATGKSQQCRQEQRLATLFADVTAC